MMSQVLVIDDGMLLVATDLHGNGHDFNRVMERFLALRVTYPNLKLLILGDLIHSYNAKTDESFEMVHCLMKLEANQSGSCYVYLMGNHELAHIYHWALMRGNWDFTKGFEWKMAKCRQTIIDFFHQLPLAVVTKGGVLLHHTGAAACYSPNFFGDAGLPTTMWQSLNHLAVKRLLQGYRGDGNLNAQLGNEIMQLPQGNAIWDAWMNGNEHQYGQALYETYQSDMLSYYSQVNHTKLNVLVTGHIAVPSGVETVGDKQVRLCSGQGCSDDLQKKLLLIEATRRYNGANELAMNVLDVY